MSKAKFVRALAELPQKSFDFIGFNQLESVSSHCQNCGHAIAAQYFLKHRETGDEIEVGSECVINLLIDAAIPGFKTTTKRLKKAEKQFKANNPPARPDESRAQYLTRRVVEQANALIAHHEWTAAIAKYDGLPLAETIGAERANKRGLKNPHLYNFPPKDETPEAKAARRAKLDIDAEIWAAEVVQEFEGFIQAIEDKHKANRFDFQLVTWEVQKI